jgi:hypothetical protein
LQLSGIGTDDNIENRNVEICLHSQKFSTRAIMVDSSIGSLANLVCQRINAALEEHMPWTF